MTELKLDCPKTCPLYPKRRQAVWGTGPRDAKLVVIAEGPGEEEVRQKKTLVGPAGQLLQSHCEQAGINYDEIYRMNIVRCRPTVVRDGIVFNRPPVPREIESCTANLENELRFLKGPNVIGLLGNIALKKFMGVTKITEHRGEISWNAEREVKLLPTYHPSYLLRMAPEQKQVTSKIFLEDLRLMNTQAASANLDDPFKGCKYWLVTTIDGILKVKDFLALQRRFTFDLEWDNSGDQLMVLGIGFSWAGRRALFIPIDHPDHKWDSNERQQMLGLLKTILTSSVPKAAQYGKSDYRTALSGLGIRIKHYVFDTLIIEYLTTRGGLIGLKAQASTYLGMGGYERELTDYRREHNIPKNGMRRVPLPLLSKYCCGDADVTYRRWDQWRAQKIPKRVRRLHRFLVECGIALAEMETIGVKIDQDILKFLQKDVKKKIINRLAMIKRMAGRALNPKSHQQLSQYLYRRLGLPIFGRTKKSKKPSTEERVLKKLIPHHKIIRPILDARRLLTNKSMFVDKLPAWIARDGRAHTTYNHAHAGARTGRLTSEDPNLQQFPRDPYIRNVIVADEGYLLISADYSQLELRCLAEYAGPGNLQRAFYKGRDIHGEISEMVLDRRTVSKDERSIIKQVNFSIVFGGGPPRVAEILWEMLDEEQVIVAMKNFGVRQVYRKPQKNYRVLGERIYSSWHRQFPEVRQCKERFIAFALEHGYVQSMFGFRRYLPFINSRDPELRGHDERRAINTPVQSSAAYICLLALLEVRRRLARKCIYLIEVHDQLVSQARKNIVRVVAEEVRGIMEHVPLKEYFGYDFQVPITVDIEIGKHWGTMEKVPRPT